MSDTLGPTLFGEGGRRLVLTCELYHCFFTSREVVPISLIAVLLEMAGRLRKIPHLELQCKAGRATGASVAR
uniref:AraC family transcriptional regulator n=1 Tax=Steinernema glaseri TaxID=37863 RepID=A0A1I8ABJ9_9BILA